MTAAADTEPRRLTPTERLHEVTMAFASRAASPPEHAMTLTRNAKGDVQIELTVRGHDLLWVVQEGVRQFEGLCVAWPRGSEAT